MSNAKPLHDRIAGVFCNTLHIDVPSFQTDLFDTGVLDSMAFVELLVQLEREFGVTTSVDDLEPDNFRSIETIANFIEARRIATA